MKIVVTFRAHYVLIIFRNPTITMDTSRTLIILHKTNDDLALHLQRNSAIKGTCNLPI